MFVIHIRYIMEKVDLVLVGAESVVESGGIINKVVFVCLNYFQPFITKIFLHNCEDNGEKT